LRVSGERGRRSGDACGDGVGVGANGDATRIDDGGETREPRSSSRVAAGGRVAASTDFRPFESEERDAGGDGWMGVEEWTGV